MFIYKGIIENDFLIKTGSFKTVNHYKMKISGWYAGGFSAASDTEALHIFKRILRGEKTS